MRKLLLATAALLALAVPASADTYQMDSFDLAPGAQTVQILSPINLQVSAGQVILHSNTQGDLQVWCLDLTDMLFKPYLYEMSVYTSGDRPGLPAGGLSLAQVRQIASLMEFGLTVNPDGDSDAAVQLAIWKTEYGANFADTNLSPSLALKVGILLADSANGGLIDCPQCTLTILSDAVSAPNQAMGFVSVAVPGPVVGAGLPGLLALFGFGGFSFWKRRTAVG
jgi:hypothetical protein